MDRADSEKNKVGLIRQEESMSPTILPEKAVYISDENVFNLDEKNSKRRAQLRKHKAWLEIKQLSFFASRYAQRDSERIKQTSYPFPTIYAMSPGLYFILNNQPP